MLGLLALLLGFNFSLSVQRYDARRLLVVDEANAIGTAWLRSSLAPPLARDELRALLRRYAQLRLDGFGHQLDLSKSFDRHSQEMLARLWHTAADVAAADPHSVVAGLLVQAVNAVVDLHSARMAARQARVPTVVVVLLTLVACVALCWVGVGEGLGSGRRSPGRWVLSGLLAATLVLTLDIDRPTRGLVRVSQEPMRSVVESMEEEAMDRGGR